MKKLTLFVGIICFFCSINHAAVSGNWGCGPLLPNGCQNSSSPSGISSIKSEPSIGQLIATGTHHYTKANSRYQEFLSVVELGENNGVYNFPLLKKILDESILYMVVAKESYMAANNIAIKCSCDDDFMEKIKAFDFESFQQNECLIPSIFETAREYLTENVKEIYGKLAADTQSIVFMLQMIKTQIVNSNPPEFQLIWKCNQTFFEAHLFGQYISMMMYKIMNDK